MGVQLEIDVWLMEETRVVLGKIVWIAFLVFEYQH
jgi:hypothetical protein